MAIDLASSSSAYEYQTNMLDVLAAVASEKFLSEIHSSPSTDKKITYNSKRQIKKSSATTIMSFEDIKCLPIKSLIDKFSEMTSDELTKKYSYKCLLLPLVCTMTFKSFGNEKKAHDKIKSHLLSHVQQLSLEYESNRDDFCTVFAPKSPTSASKNTDKLSKKSVKKQILQSHSLPLSETHKSAKKVKNSTFCVKKVKKKIHNLNNKSVPGLKKCYSKDRARMADSVYGKANPQIINHESLAYEPRMDDGKAKIKISDESGLVCDKEKHNAYCSCVNCTFLSDAYIKEEVDEESPSEQVSCYDEMKTSSDLTPSVSNDKRLIYLHDHNYAMSDETRGDKPPSQDGKNILRKNVALSSDNENTNPWCVIRTPPFPYVHVPMMMAISEIQEISMEEVYHYDNDGFSNLMEFSSEESKFKFEEAIQNDELMSDQGDKYPTAVYCKMNCGNATVLECVENRVNIKPSNACVPKSEISVNENDENSENMQRVEKELALKYIAKLHAKKKKRIPDSLFCQICPGKHFTAQATLIHHYRSHAGIKPYACKICSSTFTRQHSLNYHMLIHQNRSRFTCDFCGRTFRHPSHYKEHLRRHTGETPYHCTDCNLHFKTRNTFKRHLKTRHGKLLTAAGIETMSNDHFTKYIPKTKLGKQ